MKLLWQPVLLALAASLAGCATSRKPAVSPLTGDILVDAPRAIASGPARDRVIWQYRLAAAAMRQGKFDLAKQNLDEVLLTLGGIYGKDPDAKKARGYFRAEARKTFIGEPYERSMAYIYRGILYWMDGERDNARACLRSAEFEDSDAALQEYAGDWVLPDYLDGLATAKLGGDGSDAFQRAQANARGVKLPPARPEANVLFFVEFGPGPAKYATGQYQQELRFNTPASPVASAMLKVDARQIPIAPTDDVGFQATTRGGRVMDHVLGNKAVFKSATDAAGTVAMLGGITTAVASRDRTTQQVGLGIALAGLATKLVSGAAVPAADTRAWDNLPRYLSFACLPLPVGQHVATLQFLDSAGQVQSNLTKTITLNIATTDRDKVVFVSDASITPQTL